MENTILTNSLNLLKTELSKQWNKPKKKNLHLISITDARNYKKIKTLQKSINAVKKEMKK